MLWFSVLSILHFFAFSEIHGILLALMKEIERSLKRSITGHYKFEKKDGKMIIKTFYYFLTKSNYHDSSQINFNYVSSIFTLSFIKLFRTKYNILIVYFISILVVAIFSFILIAFDYRNEEELKKQKNYSGLKIFGFIIIYVLIYCFAGFISLLPHKLLDDIYKKEKEIFSLGKHVFINGSLLVAVTLKNIFNIYLLHPKCGSISKIIFWETIIFSGSATLFLLILLIIVYRNYKIIKEDEQNYSTNYIGGFLMIKYNKIFTLIEIKGFGKYILSLFKNYKILLILFINLCSRLQKLKFKREYKEKVTEDLYLCGNFFISFAFYILLFIGFKYLIECKSKNISNEIENNNNEKDDENKIHILEKIMIYSLIIEFLSVLAISVFFYLKEDSVAWITYVSIALTGSLNYFLYYYYSTQTAEFISLSGVISLAQLGFRGIEGCLEPFDSNSDYIWQFVSSSLGLILSVIYLNIKI